jgi:hypothetical protein
MGRLKDDIEGAVVGAAAGAAVFYGIRGLAKLIAAPFTRTKHELDHSHARLSHQTVIVHNREVREVYIRNEPTTQHNTTIDMGEIEQYDPYDINNLVSAQNQWDQNQERIRQEQNFNTFCTNNLHRQWEREGGSPAQKFQQAINKANRKAQVRKEKGIISSWFTK